MKPYQRGDVVVIDVPMLANSHIQAGKRPWVVVQNNVGNQFSSTSIVVPLTTKIKRLELPTHVAVTWGSLQPSMVESIVEKYIKKVRADLQPLKKFAKESAENG